jgi:hypothetical protein
LAVDGQLRREPGGEVERIHRVDDDLAAERVGADTLDDALGDVAQQGQNEQAAARGGLLERARRDARRRRAIRAIPDCRRRACRS